MAPRENGITRFGLRNFKAFRYLEDIELKPLTLLVGANSSGKSSIFQSLLLLKQSLLTPGGGGPLKFDGDWVKLGGISSVISDFDTSRPLEYRFGIETSYAFALLQRGPRRQEVDVKADARLRFDSAPDGSCELSELELSIHEPDIGSDSILRVRPTQIELGGGIYTWNHRRFMAIERFLPNLKLAGAQLDFTSGGSALALWSHAPLVDELRDALSARLDYLGPVRADPRPFYPVSEDPWVGTRGEGAIAYLLRHRNDDLRFSPDPSGPMREGVLLEAVNHWLRRMNVAQDLALDPIESIAYTAAIRTPLVKSRSVNLSQVGFGVSQLLPVLVQGLGNARDAWILFEQPEIHLHPRLQGELGDFFLACARAGKTLMVETHSDHMVHRVRRRIAEDPTGELASMVQILFVHPGTEDNPGSYVEPLRVAPDGSIENWPEDFLQDAADEAWAILRARKARQQQAAQ